MAPWGEDPRRTGMAGGERKLEGMVRVRVNARTGHKVVPMVGLLPRAVLEEVRERVREAVRSGVKDCRIEARLKSIDPVSIQVEGEGGPAGPGRRLVLGLKVRGGPRPEGGAQIGVLDIEVEALEIANSAAAVEEAKPEPQEA